MNALSIAHNWGSVYSENLKFKPPDSHAFYGKWARIIPKLTFYASPNV